MQIANIMLSLNNDHGNTVPKGGVTAAEIAVLRLIHGEESVQEVEPTGEITVSHREEIARLRAVYGRARIENAAGQKQLAVDVLFPGAAARVFTSLEELELPESFFKAKERMAAPPAPVEDDEPVKAKPKRAAKPKKAEAPESPPVAAAESDDGIDDMSDGKLFE